MKKVKLGSTGMEVPAIIVGCMRLGGLEKNELNHFIHTALEAGTNYFDHADIYGRGICEEKFGEALKGDSSIKREDLFIQSKCGIVPGVSFDFSKEHIIEAVEGSLKRLGTDYLDSLLLHRPDALCEPDVVAEAFDELYTSGKVRMFGVSNHKPMQIELLKKYVKYPIIANQLQFSVAASNMVANGLEVNMVTENAPDRDGSVLDYSRLNDITIQTWSPFRSQDWSQSTFFGNPEYAELNKVLDELAEKYNVTNSTIAAAWILRHPAGMQIVTGTSKESRFMEIVDACNVELTRAEWYKLYMSAGHILP